MELRKYQEAAKPATDTFQGKMSRTKRAVLTLSSVAMTGLALVGAGVTANASSAANVSLPQSVAPQVASAKMLGATSSDQKMQLALTLRSRNAAGLADYASQVANPKAKLYHQYLTPAQFAATFGADPATLNAAEKYFQGQGLHLDAAQSGGLFLTLSGSVSQVSAALHTHINNYKTADGRAFYANADALQVPAAFAASVEDIAGTENARITHASGVASSKQPKAVSGNAVTCPIASVLVANGAAFTGAGLIPTQIKNAYNMTGATPGSGVWVAMIEQDGFSQADLNQYATCFLTAGQQAAIAVTAGTTYAATSMLQVRTPGLTAAMTPGANAQAVEAELETLLGLTPNLAHVTVVETAPTAMGTQLALADIANNNGPQVVGTQWGMAESDLGFANAQAEEQIFMQMALQGQSVFAATGNSGLYANYGDGKNFQQNNFGVMDPASDPFVTAVGGNEVGFSNIAGAAWAGELPWSNANVLSTGAYAAGGGGLSQFWSAMPWQKTADAVYTGAADANNGNAAIRANVGVLAAYNNGTTPARVIPDVSAAADPTNSSVAIFCTVGSSCSAGATTFTNVGGTNIANAIWVATAAEAAQAATGRIGNVAPQLYSLYQQDVTSATNGAKVIAGITPNTNNYCDYPLMLGITDAVTPAAAGTALAVFRDGNASCTVNATVLHQTLPFAISTSFNTLFPAVAGFQQPATTAALGGSLAGYAVTANGALTTLVSGYNALTGLGSPNVGVISTSNTGLNLAGYLSNAARAAMPRAYMVAQSAAGTPAPGTYWIGSYGLNPYVQNMPTNTQWSQLNAQVFTGAPSVIDDAAANAGVAKNLYIFGPTSSTTSTVAVLDYNIASQTTTLLAQTLATAPSGTAGNGACINVTAFMNSGGTNAGVYCVTSTGNLYSNVTTALAPAGLTWTATWSASQLLSNVSGQPTITKDSSNNYFVVLQNTGSTNLQYQYFAAGFTALTNGTTAFSLLPLATTCNSTPATAYVPQISSFAATCTAADTKNMWANVYSPTKVVAGVTGNFAQWQSLGQPSPGVTFLPGAAVAVDSIANDAGYGQVMYIAEGSDKAMYLNVVNTNSTTFLNKIAGWQSVSLPGIFNSNSAADFAAN